MRMDKWTNHVEASVAAFSQTNDRKQEKLILDMAFYQLQGAMRLQSQQSFIVKLNFSTFLEVSVAASHVFLWPFAIFLPVRTHFYNHIFNFTKHVLVVFAECHFFPHSTAQIHLSKKKAFIKLPRLIQINSLVLQLVRANFLLVNKTWTDGTLRRIIHAYHGIKSPY